jgi:hypothetical protein
MKANADRAYGLMEGTEMKQLLKGSEVHGASPEMKAAAVREIYSALHRLGHEGANLPLKNIPAVVVC